MNWIKRNLFLVVGGLLALVLLGFGGYYLFAGIRSNAAVESDIEATKGQLNNFYQQVPFPHKTNTDAARKEAGRVREAVTNARAFFLPLPFQNVKDVDFTSLLDTVIDELVRKAATSDIKLPDGGAGKTYAFSFQAQRGAFKFPEGSFPALPQQLAEIKAMCHTLFDARITHLLSIKRAPVGVLDGGGGGDFLAHRVTTNAVTGDVVAPYEISFVTYSKGLADTLNALQGSKYGFVVKSVVIEPFAPTAGQPGALPGAPPPGSPVPPPRGVPPGRGPLPPGRPVARPGAPGEEWIPLMEEARFKVTLAIELIRPAT